MGLAEKQAMAQFKEKLFPDWHKKLTTALGKPIDVTFEDMTFTTVDGVRYLPSCFFDRFTADVAAICKDKLGKEAMQGAVTSVCVKYTPTPKDFKLELSDSVFTVTAKWDGSLGTDCPAAGAYKTFFMSKL